MAKHTDLTIRRLQHYIKQKDCNPEHKHAYFLKLIEEVGELADVLRKNSRLQTGGTIKGTIEEELYDVLYYVLAIANLYDIDMETCCRIKEQLNQRKYGITESL